MAIDIVEDSDEWIDEWQTKMNESEEYDDAGQGWGVDFNGSFIFEVEAEDGLEEPLYFYIDPVDGTVEEARTTDDPDGEDWGFWFSGPYSNWKKLIQGEVGAIDGLMSGAFNVDGDMQKVLQYSQASKIMTGMAAEIDTEFEY